MRTIDYLKEGEDWVSGDEMLRRGGSDMAGQEDCEWYLANQEDIPEEYRGKWLVFGGWARESGGRRIVPCLRWDGDRWVLDWYWLGFSFGRRGLLVRVRKLPLKPSSLDTSLVLKHLDAIKESIAKIERELKQ